MVLNLNNYKTKIIYQVIMTDDIENKDIYPSSITPEDATTADLMILLTYLKSEIICLEEHLFTRNEEED